MLKNFQISLNISEEKFLEILQELTYQKDINTPQDLQNLQEYDHYNHPIVNKVFVGEVNEDGANLALISPKKFSHFTPLPYLLFWIDKKSPGTYLLAKAGYDLPDWFFSSTCTDMALAEQARNFCFSFKTQSNNEKEVLLFCSQIEILNNNVLLLLSNLCFSLFPIAIIAIFTDYAVFPFLATMSKMQIKILIQVGYLLFFPYFKYLKFFPFIDTKKSTTQYTDWENFLLMLVMSPPFILSFFVYSIPNRFIIIPSYSVVLISIITMYFLFFLLNLYTVSQIPLIIREIFTKQIKDIEASLISRAIIK